MFSYDAPPQSEACAFRLRRLPADPSVAALLWLDPPVWIVAGWSRDSLGWPRAKRQERGRPRPRAMVRRPNAATSTPESQIQLEQGTSDRAAGDALLAQAPQSCG